MAGKRTSKRPAERGLRVLTSRDEFEFSELEELYTYWSDLKGELEAPRPWEFELLDKPHLLHLVARAKVVDGGADYFIQFVGQSQVDKLDTDSTGKKGSEIQFDLLRKRSHEVFEMVVATRKPVISGKRPPAEKLEGVEGVQSLCLPLIEDGIVTEIITIFQTD